ncbi:DUF7344 domain-containing protein [Haladaptatus sp. NG-WS-4]
MIERRTKFETETQSSNETFDGSIETIFDVLGDSRRRRVLSSLHKESRPVPIADLARHLVDQETDTTTDAPSDAVERVEIQLYHVHLPKMADAGFVRYDPESGMVAPDEAIGVAMSYLELTEYSF